MENKKNKWKYRERKVKQECSRYRGYIPVL